MGHMVCLLAAVLSLDFLLISHVSQLDLSTVLSCIKRGSLFFITLRVPFPLLSTQVPQMPDDFETNIWPARKHTHELMNTTEADCKTLQLAESCFGQIEELMRKKVPGRPSGTLAMHVCVTESALKGL